MRLLIAIKSCNWDKDRGAHQTIRDTWGSHVFNAGVGCGIDAELKFFVGEGYDKLLGDEVGLSCPDDYENLPYKTRQILFYMLLGDFDYVFLADTDTFIRPYGLLRCGFESFDYCGKLDRPLNETFHYTAVDREKRTTEFLTASPWASGGFGYFLSRKAAGIVASEEPRSWAEDLSVGQILGPLHNSGEIKSGDAKNYVNRIAWHCPENRKANLKDWMNEMYREHR